MAKSYRIAVIAGDGIGHEVMPQGVAAMEAAARAYGLGFTWNEFDWSWERSTDGGATWNVIWPIHYTRMGKGQVQQQKEGEKKKTADRLHPEVEELVTTKPPAEDLSRTGSKVA